MNIKYIKIKSSGWSVPNVFSREIVSNILVEEIDNNDNIYNSYIISVPYNVFLNNINLIVTNNYNNTINIRNISDNFTISNVSINLKINSIHDIISIYLSHINTPFNNNLCEICGLKLFTIDNKVMCLNIECPLIHDYQLLLQNFLNILLQPHSELYQHISSHSNFEMLKNIYIESINIYNTKQRYKFYILEFIKYIEYLINEYENHPEVFTYIYSDININILKSIKYSFLNMSLHTFIKLILQSDIILYNEIDEIFSNYKLKDIVNLDGEIEIIPMLLNDNIVNNEFKNIVYHILTINQNFLRRYKQWCIEKSLDVFSKLSGGIKYDEQNINRMSTL